MQYGYLNNTNLYMSLSFPSYLNDDNLPFLHLFWWRVSNPEISKKYKAKASTIVSPSVVYFCISFRINKLLCNLILHNASAKPPLRIWINIGINIVSGICLVIQGVLVGNKAADFQLKNGFDICLQKQDIEFLYLEVRMIKIGVTNDSKINDTTFCVILF